MAAFTLSQRVLVTEAKMRRNFVQNHPFSPVNTGRRAPHKRKTEHMSAGVSWCKLQFTNSGICKLVLFCHFPSANCVKVFLMPNIHSVSNRLKWRRMWTHCERVPRAGVRMRACVWSKRCSHSYSICRKALSVCGLTLYVPIANCTGVKEPLQFCHRFLVTKYVFDGCKFFTSCQDVRGSELPLSGLFLSISVLHCNLFVCLWMRAVASNCWQQWKN